MEVNCYRGFDYLTTHLWLRSETKPAEERTVLPPPHARQIMAAGFQLTVEKSTQSAYDWRDYERVGCEIVEEHSWRTAAPKDAIILGLKELDEGDEPLSHHHIHFAHVYKHQAGWEQFLSRFDRGGGKLFDLEFLVDESGRRIAAFGHWAGFAGAGLAMLAWSKQTQGKTPILEPVKSRESAAALVAEAKTSVEASVNAIGRRPKVMVIGARGRCGLGAVEFLEQIGAEVVAWDIEETSSGGPFREIIDCDIFMNCVFVNDALPPFVDWEILRDPDRRLSVICDVSCDPYGDYNPVPVYDRCTTFQEPVLTIIDADNPLHLIAIDHLPSLLPRESSEDFCNQLLPYLLKLDQLQDGVWKRASDLFDNKLADAKQSLC